MSKKLQLIALSIELHDGRIMHMSCLGDEEDNYDDPQFANESVSNVLKQACIPFEQCKRYLICPVSLSTARKFVESHK